MIIKEVIATRRFNRDFDNLEDRIKDFVRKIIKGLEYGEKIKGAFHSPLTGDLKGYTSIHFDENRYRLIYQETKDKLKIFLLSVGKRSNGEDFYDKFKNVEDSKRLQF